MHCGSTDVTNSSLPAQFDKYQLQQKLNYDKQYIVIKYSNYARNKRAIHGCGSHPHCCSQSFPLLHVCIIVDWEFEHPAIYIIHST